MNPALLIELWNCQKMKMTFQIQKMMNRTNLQMNVMKIPQKLTQENLHQSSHQF